MRRESRFSSLLSVLSAAASRATRPLATCPRNPPRTTLSIKAKLPFLNSVEILRNSWPLGCPGDEPFEDGGQTRDPLALNGSPRRHARWHGLGIGRIGQPDHPYAHHRPPPHRQEPQCQRMGRTHCPKSANPFRTRPRAPCLANSPPSPVLVNCTAGKDSKCALPPFMLSEPLLNNKIKERA